MILAGHAPTCTSRWYNIYDGSRTTIGQLVGKIGRSHGVSGAEASDAGNCAKVGEFRMWAVGTQRAS